MASRDLAFRDALHLQLKEDITLLQANEFERFLVEKQSNSSGNLKKLTIYSMFDIYVLLVFCKEMTFLNRNLQ